MLAHWQKMEKLEQDFPWRTDNSVSQFVAADLHQLIKAFCQDNNIDSAAFYILGWALLNRLYTDNNEIEVEVMLSANRFVDVSREQTAMQWLKQQNPRNTDNESGATVNAHKCYLHFCSPEVVDTQSGLKLADRDALVLHIDQAQQVQLTVTASMSTAVFQADLVMGNLMAIYRALATDGDQPLNQFVALSAAQQQWFELTNQSAQAFPQLPINQLFERQVLTSPEAQALQFNEQGLSYQQLNQQANQLAHYLIGQGIGIESKVVIYADRGLECLIAILAVMKSGAAFVPIDPVFSTSRLQYILQDSCAELILSQSHLAANLSDVSLPILVMDNNQPQLSLMPQHNPNARVHLDNLAYILYTSGSTGQPKGVMVAHRGVTNLIWSMSHAWQVNSDTRFLQFASMSFDASVPEWACTLIFGGCVVFKPCRDLGLDNELLDLLEKQQITIIKMPAAALNVLPYRDLPQLKVIITAGDACDQTLVNRWANSRNFFNCYGPTEMSIGTSMYPCDVDDHHPCIGRPNFNTQVYVLDEALNQLPVGMVGEIYLSGVGVTRGYNAKAKMTAEKYLPNPFKNDGSRLYRSGDMGYIRHDGMIEFCGRTDNQVKIRGLRVELGEIERVLLSHPDITEVCVTLLQGNNHVQHLAAYFTASAILHRQALSDWLSTSLPDYMVPNVFKQITHFALTTNGKIDRKALPALSESDYLNQYEMPQTELERQVAQTWQQILGISRVGRSDNFFNLGGSSLNATKVCHQLSRQSGKKITVANLLNHPLLSAFAQTIEDLATATPPPALRGKTNVHPASAAQQRLWFMQKLQPQSAFYNICLALRIEGQLNAERLNECLINLVQRHEALRTRFYQQDDQVLQAPVQSTSSLIMVDLSALQCSVVDQFVVAHGQQVFDLESGELCSFKLFRTTPQQQVLSIVVHHIAADGRSVQVLINELMAMYLDEQQLADLEYQAIEYALWEQQLFANPIQAKAISYWEAEFRLPIEAFGLLDPKSPQTQPSYQGKQEIFSIAAELASNLRNLATNNGTTLFNLLLSSFAVLISRYSNNQELVIGVPMTPELPVEFADTVGLFANTLPIRITLANKAQFNELLSHVSHKVTQAFLYQQLPFQNIVRMANHNDNLQISPLFEILFAYQQVDYSQQKMQQLGLQQWYYSNGTAKYGLTLLVDDDGDKLNCRLEYDIGLFSREFSQAIVANFKHLLRLLAKEQDPWLQPLALLDSDASGLVGTKALPALDELIFNQAKQNPFNCALRFANQQLTFAQLEQKTNGLAAQLHAAGVQPGMVVALAMKQDNPLLVMMQLACLKAGCPILAISDQYPQSRVSYMIEHAKPALLVTDMAHCEYHVPSWHVADWQVDDLKMLVTNPCPQSTLDQVAYITYTSGTTGKPKGIEVCHKTLANLINWQINDLSALSITNVFQFSAVGFDVALQELFYAWSNGCCYHLTSADVRYDFNRLTDLSNQHSGAAIFMPTTVFSQFASYLASSGKSCGFAAVIVAGEQLKLSTDVATPLKTNNQFKLFNQYGPAESHVVTCAQVDLNQAQNIHIGKPINNCTVHILDDNQQQVPLGCVGQVYLAGVNLAKGYLFDQSLSQQKFTLINDIRMYATGDLARTRADGNIDFIGRKDNQLKIRGFRIEPDEVSIKITEIPGVEQALVKGVENHQGETALAAFVKAPTLNITAISNQLAQLLPDYMMPTAWAMVDEFAITTHGKIDMSCLPQPQWLVETQQQHDGELNCLLEEVVAEIWSEILQVPIGSSDAHFIKSGGHSLKLIQLSTQINEIFSLCMPISALLERPLLTQQCAYLNQLATAQDRDLVSELTSIIE